MTNDYPFARRPRVIPTGESSSVQLSVADKYTISPRSPGQRQDLKGTVLNARCPNPSVNRDFTKLSVACRAQSSGGYGVRVRLGDGNIWRGGKIQANSGGGWIEGDDGLGNGPSNTVIADTGFEANLNDDLTISISGGTRVHDTTFQSTGVSYHIRETSYAFQGRYQRNISTSGKAVKFAGTATDNVWDYNNSFGSITANETTFSADTYRIATLAFASSIATDCSIGYHFLISATSGTSFTISNPTNPKLGQLYTWDISNNSGGTMGSITFGSEFLTQGSFTSPASSYRRTITFRRISGRYVEIARNTADVV
jgi:hypothetical protein